MPADLMVNPEIARGLQLIRRRIAEANIPPSSLDKTLNIATWNVREFGKKRRTLPAIHYIAEILRQFDLVAVTEVREDLYDLNRALELMGPTWRAIYSDTIDDGAGNGERIAFVFDKRAVTLTGLVAEANPPRTGKDQGYLSKFTWYRSPYMASFSAGRFDFILMAVHVRWAEDTGRLVELEGLAEWIKNKSEEKSAEDKDIIVVGDFNIVKKYDKFHKAVLKRGLMVPRGLENRPGTDVLGQTKFYDQILHVPRLAKIFDEQNSRGGVLKFALDDAGTLFGSDMTQEVFTRQMSDHLPLWVNVHVDTDFTDLDAALKQKIN